MRVAFLGNCQAQCLEQFVLANAPELEVEFLPPIWLIDYDQEDDILAKLGNCDFIFCQRIAENYRVEFLTTKFIKHRFGDHSISWPNVYFDGYFPGIQYLYHGNRGKILGPLDEYHFEFVIEGFKDGRSVAEVARLISTEEIFARYPRPMHDSILQLTEREADHDVGICDFLITYLGARRTFFSMNHPTDLMLREIMIRLLAAAGLKNAITADVPFTYTLNKIILPMFPAIRNRFYLSDEFNQTDFKGVSVVSSSPQSIEIGPEPHHYDAEALVDTYYRVYREGEVFA